MTARIKELEAENERLRVGLRFYATQGHYVLDAGEDFDTLSGESQNWQMSGLENSSTMIENGHVARAYLRGQAVNWIDGEDDMTPQPIDGETTRR